MQLEWNIFSTSMVEACITDLPSELVNKGYTLVSVSTGVHKCWFIHTDARQLEVLTRCLGVL